MRSDYEILGVPSDVTIEELKEKFKALALKYHPDKNPDSDAEEEFKAINNAYNNIRTYLKKQGDPISERFFLHINNIYDNNVKQIQSNDELRINCLDAFRNFLFNSEHNVQDREVMQGKLDQIRTIMNKISMLDSNVLPGLNSFLNNPYRKDVCPPVAFIERLLSIVSVTISPRPVLNQDEKFELFSQKLEDIYSCMVPKIEDKDNRRVACLQAFKKALWNLGLNDKHQGTIEANLELIKNTMEKLCTVTPYPILGSLKKYFDNFFLVKFVSRGGTVTLQQTLLQVSISPPAATAESRSPLTTNSIFQGEEIPQPPSPSVNDSFILRK